MRPGIRLAHSGERLSDEEVTQESLLILIGGDETTRHVITGGLEQLLLHPEQKDKLVADPSKIPVAVQEMLRWVTPIQNMARTATRDTELRGVRMQENDNSQLAAIGVTLNERLSGVESEIYQVRNRSNQDPLNYPIKLNNKIAALQNLPVSVPVEVTT